MLRKHAQECNESRYKLQVSNFSRQWQAHMYWIDENGAMVEKGSLDAGTMTQQPCHPSHVWALVATAKLPPAKKSNYNSQSGTLAADSSCFLDESGSLGASTSSVQESSPAVLLIRPSRAALVSDKCTSIMWTPLTSLSITQRVYSKNKRAAERSKSSEPNNSEMVSSPEMHVQLFDGPQRNSKGLLQSTTASVPTTSLHTLDRTKLVRWPRRKSKR